MMGVPRAGWRWSSIEGVNGINLFCNDCNVYIRLTSLAASLFSNGRVEHMMIVPIRRTASHCSVIPSKWSAYE